MLNYKKCNRCRRKRFFVKQRRIYIAPIKQILLSQEELCKGCANLIKQVK